MFPDSENELSIKEGAKNMLEIPSGLTQQPHQKVAIYFTK
jgi:hypothetical protein